MNYNRIRFDHFLSHLTFDSLLKLFILLKCQSEREHNGNRNERDRGKLTEQIRFVEETNVY